MNLVNSLGVFQTLADLFETHEFRRYNILNAVKHFTIIYLVQLCMVYSHNAAYVDGNLAWSDSFWYGSFVQYFTCSFYAFIL